MNNNNFYIIISICTTNIIFISNVTNVTTLKTQPEVLKDVLDFGKSIGKITVVCKDTPCIIYYNIIYSNII